MDQCPEKIYEESSYLSKVINFPMFIKELDLRLTAIFETN